MRNTPRDDVDHLGLTPARAARARRQVRWKQLVPSSTPSNVIGCSTTPLEDYFCMRIMRLGIVVHALAAAAQQFQQGWVADNIENKRITLALF
jgi:hypothetical protein